MNSTTDTTTNLATIEAYIDAYNAKDFDACERMLSPDLKFSHFNRGFTLTRDELMGALRQFAADFMPDRTLGPAIRANAVGNVVYREQLWKATLAQDVEGFGKAGDALESQLSSVFILDDAGIITEYYDYG